NNTQLANCCQIYDLLHTIGAITGSVNISGNASGMACETLSAINIAGPCPAECEASFSVNSTEVCEGNTLDLFFTGTPNATVTYTVNDGSTTTKTIVLDESGEATVTESMLDNTTNSATTAKTYTFSLVQVELDDCTVDLSGEEDIQIDVYNKPNVSSFSGPASGFCLGQTPQVTIDLSFFINPSTLMYTVTDPTNTTSSVYTISVIVDPMTFTPQGSFNLVGNYTVRVVSIDNGTCVRTSDFTDATAQITMKPTPEADFTTTSTMICTGGSRTLNAVTNLISNVAYQWYKNQMPIGGANQANYAASETGIYRLEVTNTANSCSMFSDIKTLTEFENLPVEKMSGGCYNSITAALSEALPTETIFVHENIPSENLFIPAGVKIYTEAGVNYINNHTLTNNGTIITTHPIVNNGIYKGNGAVQGQFINQGTVNPAQN
ncbi:MAG TPA: hypothetical protein PKD18_12505, partial [Saprospiraceae bacterium]|nr:hypothetical protein [Saprospiraceae bacterium]